VITPLRIKNWIICELESSILLYSTGLSRESAKIIKQQSENVHGSSTALDAMHGIKNEAFQLKNCLLKGDFAGIVDSMHSGWLKKKLSSVAVSNSQIDTIFDAAIEAGALAGKVSGAGGGGFMWFFVPSEHRMDVIRSLSNFGGQISNCYFSKYGSQAWKL
jgi:D-glycero-alpha-D-manno-heptose-7-phosphate kinase